MRVTQSSSAFTLVELVTVLAIISTLLAISLPAVLSIRNAAQKTECANRTKNQTLACLNFESSHQHFPPGSGSVFRGKGHVGWMTFLLPYLEQQSLMSAIKDDFAYISNPLAPGHLALGTVVAAYQCPSDPAAGKPHLIEGNLVATASFQGVAGTNHLKHDGIFFSNSNIRITDIQDGTSNTLLIGERPASKDRWYGWWYAGIGQDGKGSLDFFLGTNELILKNALRLEECDSGPYVFQGGQDDQCDVAHFWSFHPGGANFSNADGSVRFISYDSHEVLILMSTRADGEKFEL